MKISLQSFLIIIVCFTGILPGAAQKVDYSVAYVPQEYGADLMKITSDADYVCMPTVKRNSNGVNWLTNHILSVAPSGKEFAYLSLRNNLTNIFIKDISRQSAARQRTNRTAVVDFSYSPDGEKICFTEQVGKTNRLFITSATSGYVCRQITTNNLDYAPIYTMDMKGILFCRLERKNASIWEYDVDKNYLSCLTSGQNPSPSANGETIYLARTNTYGMGEIWRVNINTGLEECILSSENHSFYSPLLSPDGSKLLLVGSSAIPVSKSLYWNTDLYVCNTDGTGLQQLTYHAAADLSPSWSGDGQYIYFISQRGSATGVANVWRLTYKK